MDYNTLIARLSRRGVFRIKPGLERTRGVLNALGDPQARLQAIHIAGTNGKGSVAACMESVLRSAGYRTGLYTSPHLWDVRERIQLNRQPIGAAAFRDIAQEVLKAERQVGYTLTFFEFLTVMAFKTFADASVEVALIETGMGGRWDATNVLDHPALTLITSIGLDHVQWLGPSETAIAREKAGILKEGTPLIHGARGRAARAIAACARKKNVPLLQIGRDFYATPGVVQWERSRQALSYTGPAGTRTLTLGLMGRYQLDNAALALAAFETLQKQGWKITEASLRNGMARVNWPGRFQLETLTEPRVLFDGAHNPPALQRLLDALKASPWHRTPKTFVFGVYRDKDYSRLLAMIRPHAAHLVVCTLPGARALPAKKAAESFGRPDSPPQAGSTGSPYTRRVSGRNTCGVTLVKDPRQALGKALRLTDKNHLVVVTGSLALVGKLLNKAKPAERGALCPV
ncbi:MAG: hypothetical protein A2992_10105 [Elusimicrobia bacterium RIFCSPLOWO2_01_FULL_59_12]|nr:MAG: hypothetical protein A2992_10105 [Elusimicrobia bacterium RIFCSPLOWO2_01_FULL_59_12]